MDQDRLHSDVVLIRNTEANLGWIRNAFYSGFNSAMFGLLLGRLHVGTPAYTALCFGGAALSLFWLVAAARTREWMTYWHGCLSELEAKEQDVTHVRVFSGKRFGRIDGRRVRNSVMLRALIITTGFVWLALVGYSLWMTDWHNALRRFEATKEFIERWRLFL